MKQYRFPFADATDLNATSGPTVLRAALSEALRGDTRFLPLSADPSIPAWYPTYEYADYILADIRAGRHLAIGPNVVWGLSYEPCISAYEKELAAYTNYDAVMTLSRWYSASIQKHFKQTSKHYILDYPLPQSWLKEEWGLCDFSEPNPKLTTPPVDALIFCKGLVECGMGTILGARLANGKGSRVTSLVYGKYKRDDLFTAARNARVCFYISREDHYPLAAVEIGLMGCPIISDEKICSVVQHGITGIIAPVRERGESDGFRWTEDAAERMAVEWKAAAKMDRAAIREATIRKHAPALMRERVAAQLGLG